MNKVLIYIVELNIVFATLYSVYYIIIKPLTFHGFNRILLLSFIPLSLIIPILNIDIAPSVSREILIPKFEDIISNYPLETLENNPSQNQFSFGGLVYIIYATGVLFYIFKVISNISKLVKLRSCGEIIRINKFSIVLANTPSVFSFFNWIFIPVNHLSENEKPIIEHEKIHFKLLHSIDLIFIEIFVALFWFNPFVYFYRKSIKSIHEYQVDAKVIKSGIKKSHYLQLILNSLNKNRNIVSLYNYFNYLTIKKRVKMITKRQSSSFQVFRYLLFVPVLAMMSMVTTHSFINDEPDIYPIKKGEFSKITQEFGKEFKHPVTKVITIHGGVDFSAKEGISVLSTASGVVKNANIEDGWGNLIIIDHRNGFETWYAHLKDFEVKKGDKVAKGQKIGFVGNTGYSTGPHLHYEVRLNNQRVNPFDYIGEQ